MAQAQGALAVQGVDAQGHDLGFGVGVFFAQGPGVFVVEAARVVQGHAVISLRGELVQVVVKDGGARRVVLQALQDDGFWQLCGHLDGGPL